MAEGAPLLRAYRLIPYRGFESLALRQAVCELETFIGDGSRKPRKARYLAGFLLSGICVTVTGRRAIEVRFTVFLC